MSKKTDIKKNLQAFCAAVDKQLGGHQLQYHKAHLEKMQKYDDMMANICKFTNMKENEIAAYMLTTPLGMEEVERYVKVFGKLPQAIQTKVIYLARTNPFLRNSLEVHYAHQIAF